jgi:thiol-disulfide isomerase/thioredoxin
LVPFVPFVFFLFLPGCSWPARTDNLNTLTGVVRYGDEPVWEGRITLLGPDNRVATTTLEPDGTFRIVNPPQGNVRVGVVNYPRPASVPLVGLRSPEQAISVVPPQPTIELPERYADPVRSDVVVEIGSGEKHLDIQLPRRAGDPPVVRKPALTVGVEVGQVAPEITGNDGEGKPFKLSEHRGKVVAILFWAHWCNLCREQFPHQRALVERMKDKPFVLLGVNCDAERDLIERENPRRGINWRSWWDGAAVGGPVYSAWQVEGLPCVVLLDAEGVIRHRILRGADLDRVVDEMVRTVPSTPTRP